MVVVVVVELPVVLPDGVVPLFEDGVVVEVVVTVVVVVVAVPIDVLGFEITCCTAVFTVVALTGCEPDTLLAVLESVVAKVEAAVLAAVRSVLVVAATAAVVVATMVEAAAVLPAATEPVTAAWTICEAMEVAAEVETVPVVPPFRFEFVAAVAAAAAVAEATALVAAGELPADLAMV